MPSAPNSGELQDGLVCGEGERTIHGRACRRFSLRIHDLMELELWLADGAGLPPFHLLTSDRPDVVGAEDPLRDWPRRVRARGLFPMLVVLRSRRQPMPDAEWSEESVRWEVIAWESGAPKDAPRFEVPEGYRVSAADPVRLRRNETPVP